MTAPTPREPVDAGLWVTTTAPTEEVAVTMKERISTLLSTVAMLGMSGGVGWGLWPHLGPWSVAIGSVLLALMVSFADSARKESEPPPADASAAPVVARPARAPLPGPTDQGNLHTKGPGSKP